EYWTNIRIARLDKWARGLPLKVLDLCTGSGCIGLAIAHHFPASFVDAIDISEQALTLCKENARRNNITNINCISSGLYQALPIQQAYDLIVANPPYISQEEFCELEPSVRLWEDPQALVAEQQGLAIIREIIDKAPLFLRNRYSIPQLWIEIGYKQGPAVSTIFKDRGFSNIEILNDATSNNRVIIGYGYTKATLDTKVTETVNNYRIP
ncbi:MAG TPA: peptide chain release factor N(5)-glutamine methyltransferase, partial [Candidatus Babeliaceae bacterium]|nr:peptide chain release factor N(5)-glutamine methyltransferase [Candidatus Babeliaceae bacterium]